MLVYLEIVASTSSRQTQIYEMPSLYATYVHT